MKKIIFLIIGVVFLGCSKSIDIEYREPVKQKVDNNSLVGVWDGILNCPDCNGNKYRYTLTITNHKGNTAKGTVKITKIPNQQYYILFTVSIAINANTLEVTTTKVTEEIEDTSIRGTYWCKENKYVFQLSSNREKLTGKWISSGNCTVFNNSNTIEINKQ